MFRRLVFTCLVAVTAMAAGRSRAAQPQVPSLLLDAQGFTASQAFDAAAGRPDTLQARFTRVNILNTGR